MIITVHDDVLIGSMPEVCGPRYMEAAVDFARRLQTAYADTLKMKFPQCDTTVQVEVKLFGGFSTGLGVDVNGVPGEVVNEPESLASLLAQVRALTFKTWLSPMASLP